MTLKKNISNIFKLYGKRNGMFLQGNNMRAMHLHARVRSFCKKIRKKESNKEVLAATLASLFARSLAYADSFINLPLIEALCAKYPAYGCAYCSSKPCICETHLRNEATLAVPDPKQLTWSIKQWVNHMNEVYGANNRKEGINYCLLRLHEEMHEAEGAHLFDKAHDPNVTLSERRKEVADECADLLAWIFSIAAVLDLDLQKAVIQRYGGKCDRCNKRPCDCGSPLLISTRSKPVDALANDPC